MKRLLCIMLVVTLLLAGCRFAPPNAIESLIGTNADQPVAQEDVLSTIDAFIAALATGGTSACLPHLDPDVQADIEAGKASVGSALGVQTVFTAVSTATKMLHALFYQQGSITLNFDKKEVIASKITDSNAVCYIKYGLSVVSDQSTQANEKECILEFKLINKEEKWYILSMREISPDADIDILLNGLNIKSGTDFSDGVAFIQYSDQEGVSRVAAIDTTGKILFEPDQNITINSETRYINGIMVIDNCLYDKTGKIIASPELTGYDKLLTENCNGYVLAEKTVESFSGDTHYIGVLNNKGEWEHPLSSDNPIVKDFEDNNIYSNNLFSYFSITYVGGTTLQLSTGPVRQIYYDIITNQLSPSYVRYESRNYQGEESGIYKYDLSGNRTLVLKDILGDTFFENAFIGQAISWNENGYISQSNKIYDYSGNVITDLSKYEFAANWSNNGAGIYYVNEHLLVPMDNGNGVKYLCLINKSGEPAFEPIKMGSNDDFYPLTESGFVYRGRTENNEEAYFFYDYEGNVTQYQNIDSFEGFYDGLALVRNTAKQYYYINTHGEKIIK